VHVEAKIYRLGRAELKLREELGRDATDEELASELDMAPKRLTRLRSAAIRPGSLDAAVGEEGDATVGELVGDERAADPAASFEMSTDQALMMELMKQLPEREALILECRFGINGRDEQTLEELGADFKVTRERIRQLQNEALRKLRQLMESENMPLAA